jgi:hypothetical protein
MPNAQFSPGSLIRARGREWIVLVGSDAETLKVRPVSGSEEDVALIHVPLEAEPVTDATFPAPTADQRGGQDAALLLRDALLLSLRRGAGPFRSIGQIAVGPRAYQLVPLLMALKQDRSGCSSPTMLASGRPSRRPSSPESCSTAAKQTASPCSAPRTWSTSGSPSWNTTSTFEPWL